MSNTVSTEATLFATTHPEVVKRTSISSVIISAILCVIGAGAFATSLKTVSYTHLALRKNMQSALRLH